MALTKEAGDFLDKISRKFGDEVAQTMKTADIDEETFKKLNRDDLLEILPGVQNFKARKSLMTFIEEMNNSGSENEPPTTSREKPLPSSIIVGSVGSPLVTCSKINFPIYSEPGMVNVSHSMVEKRNRLVRNTITSMRSLTASIEDREPSTRELEVMAKALVEKYPLLKDNKALNPDNPHETILLLLKRRLSNVKPVKKRQGPCPSKGKKKLKFEPSITNDPGKMYFEDATEVEGLPDDEVENDLTTSKEEEDMAKHYEKLTLKLKEKKPNPKIISQLLNLETKARRNYIESLHHLKPSQRVEAILKAYPCFTSPIHVLEEMQRELHKQPPFLEECSKRLACLWETLYLFAITKHLIDIPVKFCNSDEKAKTVLLHITDIFPGMKKNVPIAVEMQDEDINKESKPIIALTQNGIFVLMYGRIFSKLEKTSYTRALLIYISLFYTFHLEYIPGQETSLIIIQKHVLMDNVHQKDISKCTKIIKNFEEFAQ